MLRVFAFWEIEQSVNELRTYLRQNDLTITELLKLKYPAEITCPHCTDTSSLIGTWEIRLKQTPYKPYAFCRTIRCIHNLFNCLTTSLKPNFFNPTTLELTEVGMSYRDELRKRCEYSVTVPVEMYASDFPDHFSGFDTYKFSSSSQLQGAIEDSIMQLLTVKTAMFIDDVNTDLHTVFSAIKFGKRSVDGDQLFNTLGYKPIDLRLPIEKALHEGMCDQNAVAKRYTHFMLALLQQQLEELLVSDSYLDRLAGEMRYNQTLDPNE